MRVLLCVHLLFYVALHTDAVLCYFFIGVFVNDIPIGLLVDLYTEMANKHNAKVLKVVLCMGLRAGIDETTIT